MSLIPHHTSDPVCALCEDKLTEAHPDLGKWFRDMKSRHPELHISWSFRDQASQEQCFNEGETKLHFPMSAHNHSVQGQPLSLALDVFQIDDSGKAKWDGVFCAKLNEESTSLGYALKWGGEWKTLGDNDHFQLITE